MSLPLRFALTALVGLFFGLIANDRLKIPAGGMIGSIFGAALFNVLFGISYAPWFLKIITQSCAGGYLGARIHKEDVLNLRNMIRPIGIMLGGLMLLNIEMGLLITRITDMDLATALLSCTPGGVTEMSLIAPELGAEPAQVTLMHLVRLLSVFGIFPAMLSLLSGRFDAHPAGAPGSCGPTPKEQENISTGRNALITLAIALTAGPLGYLSGIPSGTLVFAVFAVAAYNIWKGKAYLPGDKRKYVQVGAGLLIGSGITTADIMGMGGVLLPAVIMVIGYIAANIVLSFIIRRFTDVDLTTALFATSPGGVSDMCIIAMDLGGDAPKVATMQLFRLVSALTIFPMMIRLMVHYLA